MKKSFFIGAYSFLFLIFFGGCSPSNSGSLITDAMSVTDCPAQSCASGVADPNETRIILTSSANLTLPQGSSFAEVSGECYPSLYPSNFLRLQLLSPGGAEIPTTTYLPSGLTVRCENGRFYIPVNLQGQVAGTYQLNAQLVVVEAGGAQIFPPFKTVQAALIFRP